MKPARKSRTKPRDKNWYTVRVLVKLTIGSGGKKFTKFEDRFVLISARDHKTAREKARTITIGENNRYKNSDGKWVSWQFFRIADSCELMDYELQDGTEVWWRYLRTSNPMKVIRKEILIP